LNYKGHIYLFQRAKPMLAEYDEAGNFVQSIGEGLFQHPHGLRIDRDDNLWMTDDGNNLVLKLSPLGAVLLVLGRINTGAERRTGCSISRRMWPSRKTATSTWRMVMAIHGL
jgi:hypothetical protein